MKKKAATPKQGMYLFFCLVLALSVAPLSNAQGAEVAKYPDRPITFIVPLPPGSGTDILNRVLCKEAEKFLGQPIVIVNKPGGSLTVGTAALAASKPDGYTIGFPPASALFIVPFIEKVPYHPLKDLQQIMNWGAPNFGITVKTDSPFKSFKDVVDYARQNPKKLVYGTTSKIGLHYLIVEQIARKEKIQMIQIPFKGGPEVETALLGGHIQVGASQFSIAQLEAGKTRLLLLFRESPAPEYPKIPIPKDLGYGDIVAPMVAGIAGPKGLSQEIVRTLEEAFTKAMDAPVFIKTVKEVGYSILYRNTKDSTAYTIHNYEFFGKFLKELGLAK